MKARQNESVNMKIMKIMKTEKFNYNVRRGQMPGLALEVYHQLQQGETIEVTEALGKWLLGRGYVVEVSGE